MKRKGTQKFEDVAHRKNNWNIRYNNYMLSPPHNTALYVYQSGHKWYCPPGFLCDPDIYDHYIFHYITSGRGTYTNGKLSYEIKEGDIFLIKPYETVYYQADETTPWTYYWVGFNGTEALKYLELSGFTDTNLVCSYTRDDRLKNCLHEIAYCDCSPLVREFETLGYLYQIFSLLISTQPNHAAPSPCGQYLQRAVEFIQHNYSDSQLSVQSIAEHVGIDRTHLYRIFDSQIHQSVQQYIIEYRLQKASMLLSYSDMTINNVSISCGFDSQAYFSYSFKKKYNLSPTQYKKASLQNQTRELSYPNQDIFIN